MFLKKLRQAINNTLNSLDKFEEPVQLNIKGNDTSTSSLGGLISLAIMSFLAYQFINQTVIMFQRTSQQVVQMNEFQNEPKSVSLNQEDGFVLAMSSRIGSYFFNMSQYSAISFNALYHQANPEGTSTYQILWAPCNRSNFEKFSDDLYKSYYLAYSYCAMAINYTDTSTGVCKDHIRKKYPDCIAPPSFSIQGTGFTQIYEYIELKVTVCNSSDATSIYGLVCSPNAYNETLMYGGINVNVGFLNNYIDPYNFESPNQLFIDFIDYYLNPLNSRASDVYIDMETVEDYDNYLLTDDSKTRSFYSISSEKMREQEMTPREFLLQTSFHRSKVNHITTRTYLKLVDVMANVGGLSEPLFLIGSILALGYARYKYFMIISNELYDFEKHKKTMSVNKVALDSINNATTDKLNNSNIQSSVRSPSSRKVPKIDMKEYFGSIKAKKKLDHSEYSYLKGLLLGVFRKRNPNEQLAQKAKKKVIKDLDISKIVKKIKEIDKLKMLLLNENQIKAFSLIKKPQITLEDEKIARNKATKSLDSEYSPELPRDGFKPLANKPTQEFSKYEKLYEAYKCIKEDRNTENSILNQKILSMIDEEIMRVFKEADKLNVRQTNSQQFENLIHEIQDKSININRVEDS